MSQISYRTEGVHVGPWYGPTGEDYGSGDISQLSRVQSTNFDIQVQSLPVQRTSDLFESDVVVESPFVVLNGSYYASDGYNESLLGFMVDGNFSSFSNLITGQRDYFVTMRDSSISEEKVLGIGNAMLTSYSLQGAVGQPLMADFSVRGFNASISQGTSGNQIPRVDYNGSGFNNTYTIGPYQTKFSPKTLSGIQDVAAVGQGEIEVAFQDLNPFGLNLSGNNKVHTQSFSFSFSSAQNELNRLGEKYPFHRQSEMPVRLNLEAAFRVEDRNESELLDLICERNDLAINIYSPCNYINDDWEKRKELKMSLNVKNMRFVGQQESLSIGDEKEIRVSWQSQIFDPNSLDDNFRISGNFGRLAYYPWDFNLISGEQISGIESFNEEIIFRKYLQDVHESNIEVEFTGDYGIEPSFYTNSPVLYFGGDIDSALSRQGVLNEVSFYEEFPHPERYAAILSGLKIERQYGYSGLKDGLWRYEDNLSGVPYVIRSIAVENQNVKSFYRPIENIQVSGEEDFTSEPNIPIYFYEAQVQANRLAEQGDPVSFELICEGENVFKRYLLNGEVVGNREIRIQRSISSKFLAWYDAYTPELSFKSGDSESGSFLLEQNLNPSGTPINWWQDKGSLFDSISSYHLRNASFPSSQNYYAIPSGQAGKTVFYFEEGQNQLSHFTNLTVAEEDYINTSFSSFEWFFSFKVFPVDVSSASPVLRQVGNQPKIIQFAESEEGLNGLGLTTSGDSAIFFIDTGSNPIEPEHWTLEVTGACDGEWHTLAIYGRSQDFVYSRLDNEPQGQKFLPVNTQLTGVTPDDFRAFDGGTFNNEFSGYVGEMIFSPISLPTGERNDVQEYLEYKWKFSG